MCEKCRSLKVVPASMELGDNQMLYRCEVCDTLMLAHRPMGSRIINNAIEHFNSCVGEINNAGV